MHPLVFPLSRVAYVEHSSSAPPPCQGNIDKIRANVSKQPSQSLQSMIDAEIASGLVPADAAAGGKWDSSTACALTWLKRALRFLEGMLNSFVTDKTKVLPGNSRKTPPDAPPPPKTLRHTPLTSSYHRHNPPHPRPYNPRPMFL